MMKKTSSLVRCVTLIPPSVDDNTGDCERLLLQLKKELGVTHVHIDLDLIKIVPCLLRQWNFSAKCIVAGNKEGWKLAGIANPEASDNVYGLAIDLGTTRIAFKVINLETGSELPEVSFDNPQIMIGPDVLTRIHYADTEDKRLELQTMVASEINRMVKKQCRLFNLDPESIYLVSVAGNTIMTHLFLGVDPHNIIREPYTPVLNVPGYMKSMETGLQFNRHSYMFVFPNIGSYFGGDLIAGILYSGINRKDRISILVDVGTNAEVVLGNRDWLMGCAGAAGPALEGGVTKMGMNAGAGVIDRVRIDPETGFLDLHTIDDMKPVGICGSGLIDLAAQLFLCGMIDIRGKLVSGRCGSHLKTLDGIFHFIVVEEEKSGTGSDLTLSQVDLDSLVRSKAAMYTILNTIAESAGMTPRDFGKFYVAGTFGSFINPESAISIGMLPDLPRDAFESLGNSSLKGAAMILKSAEFMEEIDKIRDSITYLELNVNQEFMNNFSGAKFLPHTDRSLFPSVSVIS